MEKRTAVLGGSFDPIHRGHVDIAKQLVARFDFAKVLFVPAYQNPLKAHTRASSDQRMEMIRLALADANEPRFELCDWEIKRPAPSFTVDTLEFLRTIEGPLCLLVGNEVFAEFSRWRAPLQIFKLASVVCFSRTPVANNPCAAVLESLGLNPEWKNDRAELGNGNTLDWCPLTVLPYSSTAIRAELAQGGTPDGLSSSPLRFIKNHRLYAE